MSNQELSESEYDRLRDLIIKYQSTTPRTRSSVIMEKLSLALGPNEVQGNSDNVSDREMLDILEMMESADEL